MANTSLAFLSGGCLPPFLDQSKFPSTGGFIDGRFCAKLEEIPGSPVCCLPCPITDWIYPDSLNKDTAAASWLSVVGLALLVFMLASYAVLPAQKTRSHYLSVCLIVATAMIAIGFTIPLAAQPDQCYNEITPNDMYTSEPCAWSGAFIVAGGLSATVWAFIRALSMNLQICWDIIPGSKFFYISQAFGWGIPAVLFTITMTLTGVSFRFGNVCHVNHANSMADFWGPLLGFAAAAGLLQLMTFGYCMRVYLKNLVADQSKTTTSESGSGLPSYNGSLRTMSARAVWRRLQKVLWLQWRGICIVTIILVDVVFFSIVFLRLDDLQRSILTNFTSVLPWLECLIVNPTDKGACLTEIREVVIPDSAVVAVLFLIALTAIQVFLFLTRPSVFPAWVELFKKKLASRSEFVSLDAKPEIMRSQSAHGTVRYTRGHDSTTFEMQSPSPGPIDLRYGAENKAILSPTQTEISSPEKVYHSPQQPWAVQSDASRPSQAQSQVYINTVSPDLGATWGHGTTSPLLASPGSPATPVVRYDSISLNRRESDYFSTFAQRAAALTAAQQRQQQQQQHRQQQHQQHYYSQQQQQQQQQQRPESSHSIASSERRYQAPTNSFSVPNAPSRQSSMHSLDADARDVHARGRGGLALNPPQEIWEHDGDYDSANPAVGRRF